MTSPDARTREEPLGPEAGLAVTGAVCPASGPPRPRAWQPAPPEQSREDTDAAWGEYPETGDDRLRRDRPPHWDDV